jgi:hypothetical protein
MRGVAAWPNALKRIGKAAVGWESAVKYPRASCPWNRSNK